jgi:copper(I)-binding protein
MPISSHRPRRRTLGLGLVATVALTVPLAACGSDDDSSSSTTTTTTATTTTKSDKPTTTTTMPGNLITVSDVWAAPTAAGEDAKIYLSITGGAAADELVSVSMASDWSDSVALVPATPIALEPTKTVALTDQGAYIEATALKKAFELNKPFEVTLTFATEPAQTVQGSVRNVSEGTT